MTTKKFIPYAHHSIDAEDIKQVNDVLTSGVITRGPYVESFENGIAEYCG
ncbi:MAG: UDP-4-amino-4,6-dideoxy-N-acetyl-beta-L-altrosamine transaminase, partial [Waddliaceae bacterium]|nr:UDP-4-amino-4,6-dideoxy-N-acetyl-beta-L-altrosamine transaminase [Waddliaceae bacterium]